MLTPLPLKANAFIVFVLKYLLMVFDWKPIFIIEVDSNFLYFILCSSLYFSLSFSFCQTIRQKSSTQSKKDNQIKKTFSALVWNVLKLRVIGFDLATRYQLISLGIQ